MGEIFAIISLAASILWLVIGWRAMQAHERIAAALERHEDQRDSAP